MSPQIIADITQSAEKFIALAQALKEVYPTYIDGRGHEHYVPGPGTRQVREAAEELRVSIYHIRWTPISALPEIDLQ